MTAGSPLIIYVQQGSIFISRKKWVRRRTHQCRNRQKKDVNGIYATGYGRNSIKFADKAVSEITAHTMGVYHLYPAVNGIIDIGGQDSKIISVSDGKVTDFLMNDKCAAGTGKFLEYTAKALEVPIEELGSLALVSKEPASITSMCTVFAESEVISLRARGFKKEDIAAGSLKASPEGLRLWSGR
ncbi:acyl-CoA dehydratase activase [Methanosarcina horonobensis]|uniref:acyl-CoA dehydratase activase n=1 Tax=Methanosarcina horonobensis TaxID=418008 RepID=UPI0022B8E064|nr:acyl-CoA dehydratase activase [Methanosarcina horonobensis]